MHVIHILKDGTVVRDLTGHVVRMEDAGALYKMIQDINGKSEKKTESYPTVKSDPSNSKELTQWQ